MEGDPALDEIDASEGFERRPLTADDFEAYWRRAVPVGPPVLTIDGAEFDDFAVFVSRFSSLFNDFEWHGSLDAAVVARPKTASSFAG